MPYNRNALTIGTSVYVWQVTGPCGHLTAYDMAEIARWADAVYPLGVARVELHDGLLPNLLSDLNYVTVVEAGRSLPSFGLARRGDGYHLWTMPDGEEVAVFASLTAALMEIRPLPAEGPAHA